MTSKTTNRFSPEVRERAVRTPSAAALALPPPPAYIDNSRSNI